MSNSELEGGIAIRLTVQTNKIIESGKHAKNPVYRQAVDNLLKILANEPSAMEIFRKLQNEK